MNATFETMADWEIPLPRIGLYNRPDGTVKVSVVFLGSDGQLREAAGLLSDHMDPWMLMAEVTRIALLELDRRHCLLCGQQFGIHGPCEHEGTDWIRE